MEIGAAGAPALRLGRSVPLFSLPAVQGGRSGPGALRSRYNMVLGFLDAGVAGESYLRSLTDVYSDIVASQARALVAVPLPLQEARMLHSKLSLPFPLLADEDGSVTRRMLGEGSNAALCVADRFGEVYYLQTGRDVPELPAVHTALEWLEYIQVQCPE